MLARRKVTYVVPPNEEVLAALDAYELLGDTPPDDHEAASEWAAQRSKLLLILEAATVLEYRFTLSTVTVAGQGRYNAATRRFSAWHKAQFGTTALEAVQAANKEPESDESQETIALWNAGIAWASIWAALSAVETRTRPLLAEGGAWEENAAPDWSDYATFEATVPGELAIALAKAADALNPGLWVVETDEKKAIRRGGVRAGGYALH